VERWRTNTRMAPGIGLDAGAVARGSSTRSEILLPPDMIRVRRWTRSHSETQSAGLSLNQPILDLTVAPARTQSRLLEEISRWQLRQRLREVMFEVTAQYIEVLRFSQLVVENRKTLGQTTEQVRLAEGRLAAEEVIESDVLQARVSDEQARRAVMEAEVSRDLAMSRLAVTLDFPPTATLSLAPVPPGKEPVSAVGQAIQVAHRQREELRIAQLTLNRTQAEREEIKAGFAPRLDLQLAVDSSTGSDLDRRDSWSAGLSLTWDLFDRGRRRLDLKTNGLQQEEDVLRIEETMRVISDDVLNAWFSVDRLTRRIASLAVERKAAEANYEVQQGKYRAGLATALEVQTALRDMARVRIEHVSATWSLETAWRDLENVLALYEAPRVDAAAARFTPLHAPPRTALAPRPNRK
jgi:outer membrane protein TolC